MPEVLQTHYPNLGIYCIQLHDNIHNFTEIVSSKVADFWGIKY